MIKSMLIVGAGGFVGTCARYLVSVFTKQWFHGDFPFGTFLVNALGCLIIGLVFGLGEKTDMLSTNQILLLTTGFCGGFTTFSAFANETVMLGAKGDWVMGAIYMTVSVLVGILCVLAGRQIITS